MCKTGMSHRFIMVVLAYGLAWAAEPMAWAAGDIKSGRMIAREQCSNCHVIGKSEAAALEAPPYGPDFMAINGTNAATLKIRLSTRHPVMSKFPRLNDQQIDDLVAYMGSVRK